MKSWNKPTSEQVSKAIALLSQAEHRRYFFDRLENPEWISPLNEKGFFKNPPGRIKDESDGSIFFPPWPESQFLARMSPDKPELVLEIIKQIPQTENVRVHEDLADAALLMPPEYAVQMVGTAKEWLKKSPYHSFLPEKLGLLVSYLVKGGQFKEALDLARSLLEVIPDRKPEDIIRETKTVGNLIRVRSEPQAYFDDYHYEEIIKKHLPTLLSASPRPTLAMLCDLLDHAIKITMSDSKEGDVEDFSYIWRSAVEDHSQNLPHGIKSILVSAVRDSAEHIARQNSDEIPSMISDFMGRRWLLFQRLSLYLLSLFPEEANKLIAKHLTDRKLFDELHLRHEYFLLAQKCFANLSPEDKAIILGWIEEGPDTARFKEIREEMTGAPVTHEDIEKYVRYWRRDRLAPLLNGLPNGWKDLYAQLTEELGEPEHPEFISFTRSWTGPTSPKVVEELKLMTVEEVVSFLRTWQPSGEPTAPTPEGLNRILSEVIESSPEIFAEKSDLFKGLEPTYVRGLITGLRDAIAKKRNFPWPPVLDLCRWVIKLPREIPGMKRERLTGDPDWGWTRKSIARLLSTGFNSDVLPFDLRTEAWEVVRSLTDDIDPRPEDESNSIDPDTFSINTTRGEAMHGVVGYALWVHRNLEKLPDGKQLIERGFTEMPEVKETLDRHLNPEIDPSPAIRSVYGHWFPWLHLLDKDWALKNIPIIFPENKGLKRLRSAAWETYIVSCAPYDNVFDALQEEYERAVDDLSPISEYSSHLGDPQEHLAEHLMSFYWRGKITLDDPSGLLARFYINAPEKVIAHAMNFVGRSLYHEKLIPQNIIERLKALWEHRLCAEIPNRNEIAAFGWWFASRKFDDLCAINQFKRAIKIAKQVKPDHLVIERLVELSSILPSHAVECLRLMIEVDEKGWLIYSWRDKARIVIRTAIQSEDMNARQTARALVNWLGARGLEFRDLLNQ